MALKITVNGTVHTVDVDVTTPLLWVLRDVIGLTGTKYGCGIERCGACTVLIDGEEKRSCNIEVKEVAAGRKVTTIEGISSNGSHPLQQAWIDHQVPQCGYCQPGQIMACLAKLKGGAPPSEVANEVQNLCVCGTYQRITDALRAM